MSARHSLAPVIARAVRPSAHKTPCDPRLGRRSEHRTWSAPRPGTLTQSIRSTPDQRPVRTTVREAAEVLIAGIDDGSIPDRSGKPYKPSAARGYAQTQRAHVLPTLGARRLDEGAPRRHAGPYRPTAPTGAGAINHSHVLDPQHLLDAFPADQRPRWTVVIFAAAAARAFGAAMGRH